MKENAIDKILNNGRAIIKPAKTGFFKDNQLANAMIKLEINNLEMKMSIFKKMPDQPKKFLIFDIGLLKGSYTLSMKSI